MYVKFCVIQRKYGNSAANGKFRGSARNSVARRKVWSLVMCIKVLLLYSIEHQYRLNYSVHISPFSQRQSIKMIIKLAKLIWVVRSEYLLFM